MSVILDLLIILIISVTLFLVVKKGFVKTVLEFASVICAVVFSKIFSATLSEVYYNGLFGNISEKTSEIVKELLENDGLKEVFETDYLSRLLGKYAPDFSDKINGEAVADATMRVTENLIGLLSYALAFITIFVFTIIAFKIISVLAGGVFSLPVLRFINKTLAYVLGVVLGIIYVMIFIAIVQIMMPFLMSMYPDVFNPGVIKSTVLFDYIYSLEWLDIFVK